MTFWQYIRDMRGYEYGRPDLQIIAVLNNLEDMGYKFPNREKNDPCRVVRRIGEFMLQFARPGAHNLQ